MGMNSDNGVTNDSDNEHFEAVVAARISRRDLLKAGVAGGALALIGNAQAGTAGYGASSPSPVGGIGFTGVPISSDDVVHVPSGYQVQVMYAWGDPVSNDVAPFVGDASETTAQQARQSGAHHDGCAYFGFPVRQGTRLIESSDRGLWVTNHEYVDQGLLFPDGMLTWTADKVAKSQAAHGVSVIEVRRQTNGTWTVVRPSAFGRRITASTPMRISGPAAGAHFMKTAEDPTGTLVKGTVNNCANGQTPWGTYLTCEENWNGYFGTKAATLVQTPDQKRHGIVKAGFGYRWHEHDANWDVVDTPNGPHRFGYVVEIDPFNPTSQPVKRTALGRFKHEGAKIVLAADNRVVCYMGCDEKNEYIYKFVSKRAYDPANRAGNLNLLDEGTLYVAKFNADGTGSWLELSIGKNGLAAPNTVYPGGEEWISAAQICTFTRAAADRAGATMMDRPEWIAVHPTSKEVYVTLTNNNLRGKSPASANAPDGSTAAASAYPAVDAANDRSNNVYGHIVRWREAGGDAAATGFEWDIFVRAGTGPNGSDPATGANQGDIVGDVFSAPDGLWFDGNGRLWIQTDMSTSVLNTAGYKNFGNNQMLCADPSTKVIRRFLTGPVGCELTGMSATPDGRTMFVNIQHPGEPVTRVVNGVTIKATSENNDPTQPTLYSHWPYSQGYGPAGRPRSATIAITRIDGGVVGAN